MANTQKVDRRLARGSLQRPLGFFIGIDKSISFKLNELIEIDEP